MIEWKEKGCGLVSFLAENDVSIEHQDGVTIQQSQLTDEQVQALIDSYNPLPLGKQEAKQRIVKQAEAIMITIENEYPSFERQTWNTQKIESESWEKNNTSPTPTLDLIAINREVDRIELIKRTLIKVEQYNAMAAELAGKRQKLEDIIDASTDIDFINSINFEA